MKYDALETYISQLKKSNPERVFVYVLNPGNAGDSLIAHGTYLFFKKINLKYVLGDHRQVYYNQHLIYAGGGNLTGYYQQCRSFLQRNMQNNKIIILPHTIQQENRLLEILPNTVTIFCREKISFKYVRQYFPYPEQVYLSPDMAFYIPRLKKISCSLGKQKIGYCFRVDREKTEINIPAENHDISRAFLLKHEILDQETARRVSGKVIEYVSRFNTIHTNRLHVCIAAYIAGKQCEFYPNCYYKNKAVYDYMFSNEPNIRFHEK